LGSFSIFHWLIVIVILAFYFIPIIKILQKAGYSGWWCLIVFVPLVNIIMFYVFAFANWPALRDRQAT
jgi:Na+/melibiose symporter-like transporter